MTKHGQGQVAARVRRRCAVGLTLLLVLAGGAGWQLWGPDTAAARSTATGLDAELARRFADAQDAAAADGVELTLTSGWRSAAEQQELVDKTIAHYGSRAKAHSWVLPPETSEHVKGLAVDVGPTDGALWLDAHAREFGLCRTYANELWHFEKLAEGAQACPELHPDASWGW